MAIPGFSAETAIYNSSNYYRSTGFASSSDGVYPQQMAVSDSAIGGTTSVAAVGGWCSRRCTACNLHGHWYDCLACGVLC
jgi:hypothetical protein